MPDPQEKAPGPITELPNPELNPLLNPTLGRNLGRWAEVYFTNPPERREEAVVELLRELEAVPPLVAPKSAPDEAPTSEGLPFSAQKMLCPRCRHEYVNAQRFCGMCGASLASRNSAPTTQPTQIAMLRDSAQHLTVAAVSDVRPSPRASTSRYSEGTSEIRWLREKNLGVKPVGVRSLWVRRYVPVTLAVLATGILFYAMSRPQGSRVVQPAPPAPSAHNAAAVVVQPRQSETVLSPNVSGTLANGAAKSGSSLAVGQALASVPPLSGPSARSANVTLDPRASVPVAQQSEDAPASPGNGSEELAQAEDYLNGRKGARDSIAAAKLLWRAVAKENASATLLLSELYRAGDGVPQSCDQARLLLNAAARKRVPQAAERLRQLERSGCR